MSCKIQTPSNQKRLTNVVVVRLRRSGLRFEVACFRNMVTCWRQGIERDLDEVLQTTNIFCNVSKGELAKAKDLATAFGDMAEKDIAFKILAEGEFQVSEKERQAELDSLLREIVVYVSKQCVDPNTKRPHPFNMVMRASKAVGFCVKKSRPFKSQALLLIKMLNSGKEKGLSIERAEMKILIQVPKEYGRARGDGLKKILEKKTSDEVKVTSSTRVDEKIEFEVLCAPGSYRELDQLVRDAQGTLELLHLNIQTEETDIEQEDENEESNANSKNSNDNANNAGGKTEKEPESKDSDGDDDDSKGEKGEKADKDEPDEGMSKKARRKQKKLTKAQKKAEAEEEKVKEKEKGSGQEEHEAVEEEGKERF